MTNTPINRHRVKRWRHIRVHVYPENWRELPEFQDFRNAEGSLCTFVEVDAGAYKYLTSSVY